MFTRISTIAILFVYLILGIAGIFIKFNLLGLLLTLGLFMFLQADNHLLYTYLVITKKEKLSLEKYTLYTGSFTRGILSRDVYHTINAIFSFFVLAVVAIIASSEQYINYFLNTSLAITAICIYGITVQIIKLFYILSGKVQKNNLL